MSGFGVLTVPQILLPSLSHSLRRGHVSRPTAATNPRQDALRRQNGGVVRTMIWATEGREELVLCGREFINSLADNSFAEVKAAILPLLTRIPPGYARGAPY